MALLTVGFGLLITLVLTGALVFTFKRTDESNKHIDGHKKILTQDGMVVKRSDIGKPLFLLGDSKNIDC